MKKVLLLTVSISMLLVWGCTEGVDEIKETIQSAEDNTIAETEFASIFDVLDDEASTNEKLGKAGGTILPADAVVKFTDLDWTDGNGVRFTIDFGAPGDEAPFGMLCQDGKYRSGIMDVHLSDKYHVVGTVLTADFTEENDFRAGNGSINNKIRGTLKITRSEENKINIDISDAKVITDKGTVKWSSNRDVERTVDAGPGIWKDEFIVTGTANGTNINDEEFTVTIDDPLKKVVDAGCAKTFVKGVLTLQVKDSDKKIIIDYDPYDNEACDNVVEADINGKKTTFTVN